MDLKILRDVCENELGKQPTWPEAILFLLDVLERSVKLQSNYAILLNGWDGGRRIVFDNAQEWIDRLIEINTDNNERIMKFLKMLCGTPLYVEKSMQAMKKLAGIGIGYRCKKCGEELVEGRLVVACKKCNPAALLPCAWCGVQGINCVCDGIPIHKASMFNAGWRPNNWGETMQGYEELKMKEI